MKTFIPGQIASAADVNANFKELQDRLVKLEADLETTPWEPLKLSTGWAAADGHTPRIRLLGGKVCIEGAVIRQVGGNPGNILTIPERYLPASGTQFIGVSVMNKNGPIATAELYVSKEKGQLSIQSYTSMDSAAGWSVPVSCTYAPRS